jgi:hypothetical protein
MTTATRKRRTPAERAAQKHDLMERLDAFRAEIAGMDPEDAVMVVLCKLTERYSPRNAELIVMQCPTATDVRGYQAWKELGRKVRGREKGIQILAPAGRREGEAPSEANPQGTEERQFFRIAYVFDYSQTEPFEDDAA